MGASTFVGDGVLGHILGKRVLGHILGLLRARTDVGKGLWGGGVGSLTFGGESGLRGCGD